MYYYAIVENSVVQNVIVADETFVQTYEQNNPTQQCVPYDEVNEDDTFVARIGEGYIDGKFVNGNQAVELGLLTVDEAKTFGFHSGQEYVEPLQQLQSLTPRQIRMVLTQYGLRQQVEDIVVQSTDYALKDWWEYSLEYTRDNLILIGMAETLGLTSLQIDEMFQAGASL